MNKLMKNKKKGFTLVEIIVVLVILAILAAVAVPAMLGFVEESRGRAYAADARVGLSAAQVVITEHRATNTGVPPTLIGVAGMQITNQTFMSMTRDVAGAAYGGPAPGYIMNRAGGAAAGAWLFQDVVEVDGKVLGITYSPENYTIVITNGAMNITRR